jgi:hypothetical protein
VGEAGTCREDKETSQGTKKIPDQELVSKSLLKINNEEEPPAKEVPLKKRIL